MHAAHESTCTEGEGAMKADRFTGQVAIIAGGASGIGRALSSVLVQQGAVAVIADIDECQTEETVACLRSQGGNAWGRHVDVTQFNQICQLVSDVLFEYGRIDFMISSAGIAPSGAFRDETPDVWERAVATNVLGVIHGTAAVYPAMIRQRSGHIVNIASLAGLIPLPGMASYSATKASVVAFSLAVRSEAAPHGIQVCVACPALVTTRIRATTATALHRPPESVPDPWFARRLQPEVCAKVILKGVDQERAIILMPGWARAAWFVYRLLPGFFYGALAPRLAGVVCKPERVPA